ncbi:hypothetical protein [Parabacteroides pacaensis]|nr:hypothetical protein [Parabacteroides pacaensis]
MRGDGGSVPAMTGIGERTPGKRFVIELIGFSFPNDKDLEDRGKPMED